MRYGVTGAAGFIGSQLAEALQSAGHDVVGFDCFTDYYDPRLKAENARGLDIRPVDLAEGPVDFGGLDGVFHLAGQPGVRSFGDVFPLYVRRNVLASQRVFEAAVAAGVRIVFASSSSVYGAPERFPTPEDEPPHPLSPYGVTKLACEHLLDAYVRSYDLDAVVLRYFNAFGPRQRPDMAFTRIAFALAAGTRFELYGDGSQSRSWTYVGDVVDATIRAMSRRYRDVQRRRCARGVDERGDRPVRAACGIDARRPAQQRGPRRPAAHGRRHEPDPGGARLEPDRLAGGRSRETVGMGVGYSRRSMTAAPTPDLDAEREVDLGRWRRAIVRLWWLPVARARSRRRSLGGLYSLRGGSDYKAAALISLGQPVSPGGAIVNGFYSNPRAIALITSSASAQSAAEQAAGLPGGALRGQVSVAQVGSTTGAGATRVTPLVSLSVRGASPAKTADAANALSALVVKRTTAPYVGTKIATYRTVLQTTRTQLRSINERIASADKAIAAGHLNALDKLTLITQLDTALQRQGNLLEPAVLDADAARVLAERRERAGSDDGEGGQVLGALPRQLDRDRRADRSSARRDHGDRRRWARRPHPAGMKVSFLVPVYNEERTLEEVIRRVESLPLDKQIVVVDDGSTDGTRAILERLDGELENLVVVSQPNRGKGAAVRRALVEADGDVVVIQDADMEYDPAEVPALIAPIEEGVADVVYGSRLSGGRPQRAYLFWHLVGNRFLSVVTGSSSTPRSPTWRRDTRRSASTSSARSTCARTTSASSPRSRVGSAGRRICGSTSCRSPTTAARTRKGRRSPGATASRRFACSSACGSPDVLEGKTVAVVVPAHDEEALDRRDAAGDTGVRRPDLRRRRRLERRDRRAWPARSATRGSR